MRRYTLSALVAFVCIMMVASSASASAIEQGDTELSIRGSVVHASVDGSDADVTTAIVGLSISRYVTTNWQLGGSLVGTTTSFSEGDDSAALGVDAILNYNFVKEGSTTIPYVGVAAGGYYIEAGGESDFFPSAGAQAGLKFFFAEDMNIFTELNARRVFADDADLDIIGVFFGLSVIF